MDDDYEPPMSNRMRSQKPGRKHWCMGCDGNLISTGAKCEVCGNTRGKGRHKPMKVSDWRRAA